MQRWGKTAARKIRFFCPTCKKTTTWKRKDAKERNREYELDLWLGGKDSLSELAERYHKTRQALWKEFQPFLDSAPESTVPKDAQIKTLILDGTYIHGHVLCALIAIDDKDNLFWKFAPYESYMSWRSFLIQFPQPAVVVMDGQKGLLAVVRMIWPETRIQRCQFHVVQFAVQYIGRNPKEEAGRVILDLLYRLKEMKTFEKRNEWLMLYRIWEKQYEKVLSEKSESGRFRYPRLRSTRLIVRRALPNLFIFLDFPDCPNTTNLVEGWVNGAIAEALRRHRGLRIHEKKALVAIVLSHLARGRWLPNLEIRRTWLKNKAKRFFSTKKEDNKDQSLLSEEEIFLPTLPTEEKSEEGEPVF